MSFLSKLGSSLKGGLDSALGFCGKSLTSFVAKKYPDIEEVLDTLNEMKSTYRQSADDVDGDGIPDDVEEEDEDGKWRPMLLTLGLLYKLQRIQDSHADSWYNRDEIFVRDDAEERRLLDTFGYYWHTCMKVATALRTIDNKGGEGVYGEDGKKMEAEDVFAQVVESTGLDRKNVIFAHATDSLHVDKHCPDFSVLVLHEIKQLLIVICGTRMIPAPKMKDVFMDLYADAAPFLDGEAHMGMAIGANNILKKIRPEVERVLADNPGYNVMVIGYSLGAGICQLLAMDLAEGEARSSVPQGTEVRCVSFGAPPVFRSTTEGVEARKFGNLFSVVYNNDGLASASVSTVTKLFMQIREVNRLGMRRRDMVKLLWNPIPVAGGGSINEDEDDDGDDDFKAKGGSRARPTLLEESKSQGGSQEWMDIRDAVNRVSTSGTSHLEHPAGHVFIFKRREGDVVTRRLSDSSPLSGNLRLRGAMFSHHMPWGYGALFDGFGGDVAGVDMSVLPLTSQGKEAEVTLVEAPSDDGEGDGGNRSSIYPDLSNL